MMRYVILTVAFVLAALSDLLQVLYVGLASALIASLILLAAIELAIIATAVHAIWICEFAKAFGVSQ